MQSLEDLVRDTLASRSSRAPDATNLLDGMQQRAERRRHRRNVLAAAAATVAAIAIAAGTALTITAGHHANTPATEPRVVTTPAPPPDTTSATTSATTTAPTTAATVPGVALQSVDWSSVTYPMSADCGTIAPPVVVVKVAYALPEPGSPRALVLVRCNAGAGSPPVALYVYDQATSVHEPHLAQTLFADTDNWQPDTVTASGTNVSAPVWGYSSNSIPRCCPDVRTTLMWHFNGETYDLTTPEPAHVTLPLRG